MKTYAEVFTINNQRIIGHTAKFTPSLNANPKSRKLRLIPLSPVPKVDKELEMLVENDKIE